uniref:Plastid light harvesting protein n=1 Tax=Chromera velia CCMP2878 TaxID=1169474 RepID=A0A0G4FTS7_9ALVE|eukprot:Cvel_3708.t1-p1 / transcript=Cvel_3708.t1 / gene=Cvel_3708 / organism=Chromera_velia_CCMP2878 / gene_product=Fucoxanthin-chlorophyll a-c binding protein D,, putative / transcript_product=Fucoxanthin-chlorophyll a-c binding protein D,, putative / location=Cvel_scaffold154:64436-66174(-) / protein_length=202 / sequence_SO=supercontig / SO=protein_coding / is_pseudo=false
MKVISLIGGIALTGCACTEAFVNVGAPVRPSRGASRVAAASDMIGSDVETKGFWDPANFSKNEEDLYKYREVELKHGRVAMLACVGWFFTAAGFHLPDEVFSETRPLAAFQKVLTERPAAIFQIVAALGLIEQGVGAQDYSKAPGEIASFGAGFKSNDPETFREDQLKELKNGRLAMLGIMALAAAESQSGVNVFEQLAGAK